MKKIAVVISILIVVGLNFVQKGIAQQIKTSSVERKYLSTSSPKKVYIGNWLCYEIDNNQIIPSLYDRSLLIGSGIERSGEQQTISIKPESILRSDHLVYFNAVYWINKASETQESTLNQIHFEARKIADCLQKKFATLQIINGPIFESPVEFFNPNNQESWLVNALCDGDTDTLMARLVERHAKLTLSFDEIINIPGPGIYSLSIPIIETDGSTKQFIRSPLLIWHRHEKENELKDALSLPEVQKFLKSLTPNASFK